MTVLPRTPVVRVLLLALAGLAACAAVLALTTSARSSRHAAPAPKVRRGAAVVPAPRPHRAAVHKPPAAPAEHADPEEAQSFPSAARARHHAAAPLPADTHPSPGARTDAEVRQELAELHDVLHRERTVHTVSVAAGQAQAPPGAPDVVAAVVAGGNAIANFPYVFGGGHASFVDSAYDCSGSVSYALAAGGLLDRPLTSGELEHWGAPGPGKWITVYANAGHTFMYVGGLRFDTSGRDGPLGSRWQTAPRSLAGFVVRHFPGL